MKTGKRYSAAFRVFLSTLFLASFGGCAAAGKRHNDRPSGMAVENPQSHSPPTATGAPPTIEEVLTAWARGQTDRSIAVFLDMYRRNPGPEAFRPVRFSEKEYLDMPCDERVGTQGILGERFAEALFFARGVSRWSYEAWRRGDRREAVELLQALRTFGAANTGPEVTRYADGFGRVIVRFADKAQKKMKESDGD